MNLLGIWCASLASLILVLEMPLFIFVLLVMWPVNMAFGWKRFLAYPGKCFQIIKEMFKEVWNPELYRLS